MKHTIISAAKAVRHLLEDTIAKTWDDYFDGEHKANSYTAGLLVCEQVWGVRWRETEPHGFEKVSAAVVDAMPELFAEYWV